VLERLLQGQHISATQYLKGQRARRVLIERATALFERVDLLASPMVSIVAPTLTESRGAAARGQLLGFTRLFNILGLPAISVPCGYSASGLPIGLQLAGRPFDEQTVLRAAHAYEQQADWQTRRPPI
jgi:aspartyl-tRNA(Asn)/glutamyl-tRNA(Gln) amidotransferase subunit A